MTSIREIITEEELQDLRQEINEALEMGGTYEEIEEIMLNYGLEMDYIEQVVFY